MTTDMEPILVVGAGPVGLTAAIELLRHNVPVRIIDAKSEPSQSSRALGTHARTLEVYAYMGVLSNILERSQPLSTFTVHEAGKAQTVFHYRFGNLNPRISHSAFIGQADTEAILRARVEELGGSIEWSCELLTLDQYDEKVLCKIRSPRGEEIIESRWLVGADGGHSRVRKLLDLPFEGASDETWIVTDCMIDTKLCRDSIHMFRHQDGNILMFPFPKASLWRVLETRPPPAGQEVTLEAFATTFSRRISEACGQPVSVSQITWLSRFQIQQRQVSNLRDKRCFLAGDAAHVHSPASGQGMNTGIQDAFNLGWKLALVSTGRAHEKLLATYNSERRPVSAELLQSAKISTRLIQSRQGWLYVAFGLAIAVQDRIRPLHQRIEKRIAATMSALAVGYPDNRAPEAGHRFLALPANLWGKAETDALFAYLARPEIKVLLSGSDAQSVATELVRKDPNITLAVLGGSESQAWLYIPDPNRAFARALHMSAEPCVASIVRPDDYLVGRIRNPTATNILQVIEDYLTQKVLTTSAVSAVDGTYNWKLNGEESHGHLKKEFVSSTQIWLVGALVGALGVIALALVLQKNVQVML